MNLILRKSFVVHFHLNISGTFFVMHTFRQNYSRKHTSPSGFEPVAQFDWCRNFHLNCSFRKRFVYFVFAWPIETGWQRTIYKVTLKILIWKLKENNRSVLRVLKYLKIYFRHRCGKSVEENAYAADVFGKTNFLSVISTPPWRYKCII